MERIVKIFCLMVLVFSLITFGTIAKAKVPLPDDIEIVAAPAEATELVKKFVGAWTGLWDGQLDSILVVEKVDLQEKKAYVIYAWDSSGQMRGGYFRYIADLNLKQDELQIKFGDKAKFKFTLKDDGTVLKGDRQSGQYYNKIKMKKISLEMNETK